MTDADTHQAIAAQVAAHSWWVLWDPAAPYIRAVIEVDHDAVADYGPPRPKRAVFIYYRDALNESDDEWFDLAERITSMTEDEFERQVECGHILPLIRR